LKVGLAQLNVGESKDDNLKKVLAAIEGAQDATNLMVFPEYVMGFPNGGLSKSWLQRNAERLDGRFVEQAARKSSETGVGVVLPIFERRGDEVYNTAVVIDKGRIRGSYRKIHLFDAFGFRESEMFRAGAQPILFDMGGLVFGLTICYDVRFPELVKGLALAGAQAIIVPAAWYRGPLKEEQWQTILSTRAHENTSYVVGVGNANDAFIGRSMVADPFGVKALDLGVAERVGYAELDLSLVEEARRRIPVLSQSNVGAYKCEKI